MCRGDVARNGWETKAFAFRRKWQPAWRLRRDARNVPWGRCQKRLENKDIRVRTKMATGTKVCDESAQSTPWGTGRSGRKAEAFAPSGKCNRYGNLWRKRWKYALDVAGNDRKTERSRQAENGTGIEGWSKSAKSTPWVLAIAPGTAQFKKWRAQSLRRRRKKGKWEVCAC